MKKLIIYLGLLAIPTIGFSQSKGKAAANKPKSGTAKPANSAGFKHQDGLDYKIIGENAGKKPSIGDVLEMHIVFKVGKNNGHSKDSVVINSRNLNQGQPIQLPLAEPKYRGDFVSGLALLAEGDSAIIRVSSDTLKKTMPDQPMPDFIKKGDYLIWEVKLVSIKTAEQVQEEKKMKSVETDKADAKTLQEYFVKNNIKPQRTSSGLYYTVEKGGTGKVIQKGSTASVMYTGKLLDGTAFDSNIGEEFHHTDPLKVKAGAGMVIPGFDEGLMLMKKGMKATFYIPSSMAYGEQSPSNAIPKNSILIFQVELTEIEDEAKEKKD